MDENTYSTKEKHVYRTPFSEVECIVHYPDENPETALRDISTVIGKVGLLDGVKL